MCTELVWGTCALNWPEGECALAWPACPYQTLEHLARASQWRQRWPHKTSPLKGGSISGNIIAYISAYICGG